LFKRLRQYNETMNILKIENKEEQRVLRTALEDLDFKRMDRKKLSKVIREMRETMKRADGVGLAATQVGLPWRLFVAEVEKKFYVVLNPRIVKTSEEKIIMEEGCLSVPGTFGEVERPEKAVLHGLDKNGKRVKIKAWGLLARVFQHEVDHLDGKLFIDRAKNVHRHDSTSS